MKIGKMLSFHAKIRTAMDGVSGYAVKAKSTFFPENEERNSLP